MILTERIVCGVRVLIRDIEEKDVDCLVDYWHGKGSVLFLESIGADATVIGEADRTRRAFLGCCTPSATRGAAVLEIEDGIAGYACWEVIDEAVGSAHFHIVRSDCRGLGIASDVVPILLQLGFRRCESVDVFMLRTAAENVPIVRLLGNLGIPSRLDGAVRVFEVRRDEWLERGPNWVAPALHRE